MADVSAPAESANNQRPAQPAQDGESEGQAQQNTLTPDAVRQMIEEASRPLHAEIRRLKEGKQPKAQEQTDRTHAERIKALEERETRLAEKEKIGSMRAAAIKAGVPEDRVDIFTDHMLARHGSQVVMGADGAEWDQFNDPESRKPIAALIDSILSQRGDVFKPKASLPNARGLKANGRGAPTRRYDEIPLAERLKMSKEDRLEAARESLGQ